MDDVDETGIDEEEGTTLATPGHLSGSVSRVSPIRVSKISTAPMSPEKKEKLQEQVSLKEEGPEQKSEERRKYEKDLNDLMDQQMQHIATLIAQKRKLEEAKVKSTQQVNQGFQEVAHQREKLVQKKRELQIEEQLIGERKRALQNLRRDIKLAKKEAQEKLQFSQKEQQYYLKRAEKLIKDLENLKNERENELQGLFIEAEGNQKKKSKLQNHLKQLTQKAEQLRDKVEYQKKLQVSQNQLFVEKRKFMKELILNESLSGALIPSTAGKKVITLAKDINKKLKEGAPR